MDTTTRPPRRAMTGRTITRRKAVLTSLVVVLITAGIAWDIVGVGQPWKQDLDALDAGVVALVEADRVERAPACRCAKRGTDQ